MNQSIDFTQIANWQRSALKNKALVRVLQESGLEILSGRVTPLAMAFHEASVASVYQQFGFSVFSPESRRLLAVAQSRQTRISSPVLLEWLDHAAYQQLADFHVLRYLDSEPDWLDLSHEFCISVIKRLVVCRPQEWVAIGLEHYPSELLEVLLRVVDLQMLAMRQGPNTPSGIEVLAQALLDHPDVEDLLHSSVEIWGHAIDVVLERVARDPLTLLAWRLEAFTTERQLLNDARLALHSASSEQIEQRALKVILVMIMLAGFEFGESGHVVTETPITFTQLNKSIESFFRSGAEQAQIMAALLGLRGREKETGSEIEVLLALGTELGVIQWAGVAKGQRGALLTSLAYQIIEPYRELIESSFGATAYSQVPPR